MSRRDVAWSVVSKIGEVLAGARRASPALPFLGNARRVVLWLYWRSCLRSLGVETKFWKHVVIHRPDLVRIGSRASIGDFVQVWGSYGVTIGNDVLIAAHVIIASATHDPNSYPYFTAVVGRPVVIEDGVWIGSGAIILPGVRIGTRSIIGAGAVVTRDIQAGVIAMGLPARNVSGPFDDRSCSLGPVACRSQIVSLSPPLESGLGSSFVGVSDRTPTVR